MRPAQGAWRQWAWVWGLEQDELQPALGSSGNATIGGTLSGVRVWPQSSVDMGCVKGVVRCATLRHAAWVRLSPSLFIPSLPSVCDYGHHIMIQV